MAPRIPGTFVPIYTTIKLAPARSHGLTYTARPDARRELPARQALGISALKYRERNVRVLFQPAILPKRAVNER